MKTCPRRAGAFLCLTLTLTLCALLSPAGVPRAMADRELIPTPPEPPRQVQPGDLSLLESSTSGPALLTAARALAHSRDEDHHRSLGTLLAEPGFLQRLDPEIDRAGSYARLRLWLLLNQLAQNERASAGAALDSLTLLELYREQPLRTQALIHALAERKSPSSEALAFWKRFAQASSPLAPDVATALRKNGSAPAKKLLRSLAGNR